MNNMATLNFVVSSPYLEKISSFHQYLKDSSPISMKQTDKEFLKAVSFT